MIDYTSTDTLYRTVKTYSDFEEVQSKFSECPICDFPWEKGHGECFDWQTIDPPVGAQAEQAATSTSQ